MRIRMYLILEEKLNFFYHDEKTKLFIESHKLRVKNSVKLL